MSGLKGILGLMEVRAAQLEACEEVYSLEDEAEQASLFRHQAQAIRELAAELELSLAGGDQVKQDPEGLDNRSLFITAIGDTMQATIIETACWRAAIAKFETDHAAVLEETFELRWELRPIVITPRATPANGDETSPDIRYVFIENIQGELNASIHQTADEIQKEGRWFEILNMAVIANRSASWTSHQILVPPRRSIIDLH